MIQEHNHYTRIKQLCNNDIQHTRMTHDEHEVQTLFLLPNRIIFLTSTASAVLLHVAVLQMDEYRTNLKTLELACLLGAFSTRHFFDCFL